MYIIGEDPVICDPNTSKTRAALESLDFLVVQDIFLTATAKLADVVLPAAAWAEKDGSYTSMERRIQWVDRAVNPPGEAKEGLWIIREIARRIGIDFNYSSAAEVLQEINRNVPQYKGATRARISKPGGVPWPCPNEDHPGMEILHTERFSTPDGRANIFAVKNVPPAEEPSPEYPILLTTGRIVTHYNGGSMTRRSPSLQEKEPELYVEMNPEDGKALGIVDGGRIMVSSVRGKTVAKAKLTDKVRPGVAFMPFHYQGANLVTSDARDPISKIPEYKMAACKIEPAE